MSIPAAPPSHLDRWYRFAEVLSVIVGTVISVVTIGLTMQKEASARKAEAEIRRIELTKYEDQRSDEAEAKRREAARTFLDLRQKFYLEAIKNAAILSSPEGHSEEEKGEARKRFWELYWAELALVEGVDVEGSMKALGEALEPGLKATDQQRATLKLAHALRDSLLRSWGVDESVTGDVRR